MLNANGIEARRQTATRLAEPPDFCVHPDCESSPVTDATTPLCETHLRLAFAYVLGNAALLSAVVEAPEPELAQAKPPQLDRPGHVYFMRKDGLIKIGWSSQVDVRLAKLRPDEVLHVEPGTIRDERRCHAAFVHLRVHHEYFSAGPDLLAFIAALQAKAA